MKGNVWCDDEHVTYKCGDEKGLFSFFTFSFFHQLSRHIFVSRLLSVCICFYSASKKRRNGCRYTRKESDLNDELSPLSLLFCLTFTAVCYLNHKISFGISFFSHFHHIPFRCGYSILISDSTFSAT